MRITRLALALTKGTRHLDLDEIELDAHGPVGDRAFCLVDPGTDRVLRTVEHPTLLQLEIRRHPDGLALILDGHTTAAETRDAADGIRDGEYWGRTARIHLQDTALNAAFSAHLGREVVLARAGRSDVVYADPVSIVTTGALRRLADAVTSSGYAVPPGLDARFRATMTLDSDDDPPPGTLIEVGEALIEVTHPLERCAVVDLDPVTGGRNDLRLLPHLRSPDGRLLFGVGARVIRPGRVRRG